MRGLRGGCFAAIGGRATTNIGSQYLLDGVTAAGEIKDDARAAVMAELRRHFRPEFLNRVDEIVPFKPLTQAEIERIVRFIAAQGFDPVYRALPLRRFIARSRDPHRSRPARRRRPRRRGDPR